MLILATLFLAWPAGAVVTQPCHECFIPGYSCGLATPIQVDSQMDQNFILKIWTHVGDGKGAHTRSGGHGHWLHPDHGQEELANVYGFQTKYEKLCF